MKDICEKFIQFGTGGFLRGFADRTIQKLPDEDFFQYVLSVASGTQTQNEKNDCREIALFKSGVTL